MNHVAVGGIAYHILLNRSNGRVQIIN